MQQERQIVTSLVLLMLFLWLGFLWHRDSAFPGSFWGSMTGIAGAFFMLVPLWYLIIKRTSGLKKRLTARLPMPVLLKWHIYAGILGPILGLLHSAHRFESIVGISLTLLMIIVVISGFTGRYLLTFVSASIRDKQTLKEELYNQLQQQSLKLNAESAGNQKNKQIDGYMSRLTGAVAVPLWQARPVSTEKQMVRLIDSISDVDYSISVHNTMKHWFKKWLKLHIVLSTVLYLVLFFHIFSEVYFGLRWL